MCVYIYTYMKTPDPDFKVSGSFAGPVRASFDNI